MDKISKKIFSVLFLILSKTRSILGIRESARAFSNKILKKYLCYFSGDIINVSGWEDKDKEGGYYKNYYKVVKEYYVSNIQGTHEYPSDKCEGVKYIFLDLEKPLDENLVQRFDVVFNHTVLEHVFDTEIALKNLISLTKDVIIIVVPFSQGVHYTDSYGDYHRFAPLFFKKYLEERGFNILLCCANEQPFENVYLVVIAPKYLEKYKESFKNAPVKFDIKIHPSVCS